MSAEDLTLVPGTIGDIQTVAVMARDLIERGLGWTWTPTRIRRAAGRPDTMLLIAREGEEIAGFALMHFKEESANLLLLAVAPAWRGRGVGRRLLSWLETSARSCGIRGIKLEVRVTNTAARAFYLHLGYRETAILKGYYRGRESAVRMVHQLAWWTPRAEAAWEYEIDKLLSSLPHTV